MAVGMKVIKCGTRVTPKLQNFEGIITGISIRYDKVSYEVSYFYNGDYKSIFMDESEFDVQACDKTIVGFK